VIARASCHRFSSARRRVRLSAGARVGHDRRLLPFGVSICLLSLVQGAVVALPAARELPALGRLRSGWWAAIPLAAVVGFVFAARALSGVADGLTYLALISVPPLAVAAAAWGARGARPWRTVVVPALFALAWADRGGLGGEAAGVALDVLSAVTLAVILVAVTPRALAKLGIVAMAVVDVWLVASDLLSAPNRAINAAAPAAHLPQLQRAVFGSAVVGYEDLFIAALLGALLAATPRLALRAAVVVALLALLFDLLFLAVSELPATVPVAVALVALDARDRRLTRRARSRTIPAYPDQ